MDEVDIPKMDVAEAELKLAKQLIDQLASEKFDPSQYKDEVTERIEQAVQQKVEGQEITMSEEPAPKAQVIDLMQALRASLEKKGIKPAAAPAPKAAEKTRKPARRAAAAPAAEPARKSGGRRR